MTITAVNYLGIQVFDLIRTIRLMRCKPRARSYVHWMLTLADADSLVLVYFDLDQNNLGFGIALYVSK